MLAWGGPSTIDRWIIGAGNSMEFPRDRHEAFLRDANAAERLKRKRKQIKSRLARLTTLDLEDPPEPRHFCVFAPATYGIPYREAW